MLHAEGTADALVLWVLARELRMLAQAADAIARRASPASVLAAHRVPKQRIGAVERTLQKCSPGLLRALIEQCAWVDRIIKGVAPGDPWHRLAVIADTLAAGGFRIAQPPVR